MGVEGEKSKDSAKDVEMGEEVAAAAAPAEEAPPAEEEESAPVKEPTEKTSQEKYEELMANFAHEKDLLQKFEDTLDELEQLKNDDKPRTEAAPALRRMEVLLTKLRGVNRVIRSANTMEEISKEYDLNALTHKMHEFEAVRMEKVR